MRSRVRRTLLRRAVGPVTVVVTVGPGQQRHLAQCRASLAVQTYRAVKVDEVVWTTDLAQARNAGVRGASGSYVLLIEASDTLLPDAVTQLARALRSSGAGMAAGLTTWTEETWRDRAFRAPPGDDLRLDNRLIDKAAWTAAGLVFDGAHGGWPTATVARAHRVLGTVGVAEVVHRDHARSAGLPFGHLRPWATQAQVWSRVQLETAKVLQTHPLLPTWSAATLDRARLLDDCAGFGDEDWRAMSAACRRLLDVADPDGIRVEARVGAALAAEDRRDDLAAWVESRWRAEPDLPTVVADGRVNAVVEVGDLPAALLQLSPRETPLFTSLRRWRSDPEGLRLDIVALIRGVDPQGRPDVRVALTRGEQELELDVALHDGPEAAKIAADAWHDHPHALVRATLPRARIPLRGRWSLTVRMDYAGITREGVVRDRDDRAGPGQPVHVGPAPSLAAEWRNGEICFGRVRTPSRRARVSGVRLEGDTLVVVGTGRSSGRLVATGPGARIEAEVTGTDGGFRAVLSLRRIRFGRTGFVPMGEYRLDWSDRSALALAPDLLGRTPTDEIGPHQRLRVRVAGDGHPLLELSVGRADDQLGPSAQRRLQLVFAEPRELDPRAAYFQSFTGQHVTDNPLAIARALAELRPDVRVHWGIIDGTVPVPEGTTPVLFRSPEWYDALATSSWIVTNIELERWFRRRPGQQVLQTWHGNPGKVMGRALWEVMGYREPRIRAELQRRRETWTAMLSPTEEMAAHYRTQFEYDGTVLALGHPRNDVLVGPDAAALRARARADLELAEDQTAVLYAPTWRDDLATNYRAGAMPDHLDLRAASAELGEDHVLLVRGHRFHRDVSTLGARVLDVTDHPEINELILAADVGVFDYSSLRFDFGLTGKPMLFLVPDLASYETGRGFLFPFTESAPGPLLDSTDEVVAALRDLPAITRTHASAREAFVERFHAQQDAHSAERVVRAFFGEA